MNIHCSACGAPLPQGARFCPACALPLTAIAMPTPGPPRKKPVSILAILLCAFGLFWVIAYALDADTKAKDQAALAAFTADIQADGELSTPGAFQAACGKAESMDSYKELTELAYGDLRITFQPHHPVDLRRIVTTEYGWQEPIGADFAFDHLQCKAAQ